MATAATVEVHELTGAGPAHTTCSSTATSWFRVSDAHGNSSPSEKIPIPATGVNYSYWKHYCATITANGDSNTLDNWKFYYTQDSDWEAGGKVGTSGGLKAGTSSGSYGIAVSSYDQAVGQSDSNGWGGQVITAHSSIDASANMPTSATEYDADSFSSTGTTNAIVLQLHVDTDATFGTIGAATAHFQYDES